MRVSQKLEYACRAMAQLAKRADGQTITRLDEIAQREDVSANFLVQILNDLRRADLVISKRGKLGGYLLGRKAEEISLYDIVNAVDPSVLGSSATTDGESGELIRQAWDNVGNTLNNALKNITLDTLLSQGNNTMFYI
ncbi:transcriptional regulator, BadM/Rrf2 family [Rubritalea squalenifaciens DSM 18772]|uniref:Transcriptional regulator, BadM/Rrf2 family n=2 Tax=Rubritalea TaxID=361050 RepID=A0A1M6MFT8_9BACT|nr:Rrf2 family transcriptional regulator [Rubritalea squalenifaciens]SHJ82233.1 transcriptional regulator, BadM/Rrf2 family [Rubritalea squalenifaciens DSM 18772]